MSDVLSLVILFLGIMLLITYQYKKQLFESYPQYTSAIAALLLIPYLVKNINNSQIINFVILAIVLINVINLTKNSFSLFSLNVMSLLVIYSSYSSEVQELLLVLVFMLSPDFKNSLVVKMNLLMLGMFFVVKVGIPIDFFLMNASIVLLVFSYALEKRLYRGGEGLIVAVFIPSLLMMLQNKVQFDDLFSLASVSLIVIISWLTTVESFKKSTSLLLLCIISFQDTSYAFFASIMHYLNLYLDTATHRSTFQGFNVRNILQNLILTIMLYICFGWWSLPLSIFIFAANIENNIEFSVNKISKEDQVSMLILTLSIVAISIMHREYYLMLAFVLLISFIISIEKYCKHPVQRHFLPFFTRYREVENNQSHRITHQATCDIKSNSSLSEMIYADDKYRVHGIYPLLIVAMIISLYIWNLKWV